MAQLRRELAELEGRSHMTNAEVSEAEQKAVWNLKQIAKLVGAEIHPEGALLRIGKDEFLVQVGNVRRMRRDGSFMGTVAFTCFMMQVRVPHPEYIASALLLLKHDPEIFDKWLIHGVYYV